MAEYDSKHKTILLEAARTAILTKLQTQKIMDIELINYPPKLCLIGACFVTLHLNRQLRGCIGSLTAYQPLIIDVTKNAYNAAFQDPRFKALTIEEYPHLELEISVLSTPQPLGFASEADLLTKLRPGIDGLILSDGAHRGTFLPSVWEQLPNPVDFLNHLKNKAGLPTNYWSDTISIENYTTELIS